MKKTILFFAMSIFAISIFNSCSSDRDDDKSTTPKYNVVGKWKAMQYKDTDGTWKDMAILNWYSQFNADGSYLSYSGSNYKGTYTYDNNNKITAKVGNETVIYTISTMTESTAEAEMYYNSNTNDKVTYKLQKQ